MRHHTGNAALQEHAAELTTTLATSVEVCAWLTEQSPETFYGVDEDYDSPVEAWLDKTYRDFYHFMHVDENDDGVAIELRFVSSSPAEEEWTDLDAPAWLAAFEIQRYGQTISAGAALALLNESAERS